MTDHLHPARASYPLVNVNDELVLVFRSHIPAAHAPVLYVKAITDTQFRLDLSRTLDERAGLFVVNYTLGGGNTVTLTVDGGAPTVLTEGADFNAVISNAETALQIAAAINGAALGLVASTDLDGAFVYVVPAVNSGIKTFTIASDDLTAWTQHTLAAVGSLNTLTTGQTTAISITPATADALKTVGFLKLFSGRVSVDVRSMVEFRSYLRQPATLRSTTGHPGGWPTTP
jgi:hypothetical protein